MTLKRPVPLPTPITTSRLDLDLVGSDYSIQTRHLLHEEPMPTPPPPSSHTHPCPSATFSR